MKLDLFEGTFLEGNIILMNEDFITSLVGVLDTNLAQYVLKCISNFEANFDESRKDSIDDMLLDTVTLMKRIVGDDVRKLTFHLEVIDRGIMNFIKQFRLDTGLSMVRNKEQMIDNLTWLLENRKYWITYIDGRKKENLKIFIDKCYELEKLSIAMELKISESNMQLGEDRIRFNTNLVQRIRSSVESFYIPKQARQFTGMGDINNKRSDLEVFLSGLKYQKYCNDKKVSQYTSRDFSILNESGVMI